MNDEPFYLDESTPTEKVGNAIEKLREEMRNEPPKPVSPTNGEIAQYILEWIERLDENGLIVESWLPIGEALGDSDFATLRQMFGK